MAQQNDSPTARSSACEPSRPMVTTRSPTLNRLTLPPRLTPRCRRTGSRRCAGGGQGRPRARFKVSPPSMLTASTRTSTSPGPTWRIGDVLVAEDLGTAGLVVHRCLHRFSLAITQGGPPYESAASTAPAALALWRQNRRAPPRVTGTCQTLNLTIQWTVSVAGFVCGRMAVVSAAPHIAAVGEWLGLSGPGLASR